MDRPRRSDCTAGQMDGEASWWTTSGDIGLPPLVRDMGVGRQQQHHMLETYSNMGLVMALYVAMIVLFCFPHCFPHVNVNALSICIVLRAFVVVIYMCLLYVSLGSRVSPSIFSPSIFGLMFMGSVMLSICSSSYVLYSAVSGVKRVHVVLSGLRMRLFMSLCVDVVVMLSAYVVSFTGACGAGVSDVYMLRCGGDSPPCGSPFLNWRCVDVLFLNVVYALRPLM